jgi:hypothetical protein
MSYRLDTARGKSSFIEAGISQSDECVTNSADQARYGRQNQANAEPNLVAQTNAYNARMLQLLHSTPAEPRHTQSWPSEQAPHLAMPSCLFPWCAQEVWTLQLRTHKLVCPRACCKAHSCLSGVVECLCTAIHVNNAKAAGKSSERPVGDTSADPDVPSTTLSYLGCPHCN